MRCDAAPVSSRYWMSQLPPCSKIFQLHFEVSCPLIQLQSQLIGRNQSCWKPIPVPEHTRHPWVHRVPGPAPYKKKINIDIPLHKKPYLLQEQKHVFLGGHMILWGFPTRMNFLWPTNQGLLQTYHHFYYTVLFCIHVIWVHKMLVLWT